MGAALLRLAEAADFKSASVYRAMTALAAAGLPSPGPTLPGLRQELRIEQGAPLVNGAPSWTLFDPVRHSFFQLGRTEFRIFTRWAAGSFIGIEEELQSEGLDSEEANAALGRVVEFSLASGLTISPMGDSAAIFTAQRAAQKKAWWKWMVDNYLFIRIPLVRPAAFLERTIDRVAPLWSRASLILFAMLALSGLILVSRQWDAFMASFLYFFSMKGLIAYGLGLMVVKIAHELGHAYTATRFGCRVPTMGVSLLVMMPVLYTDTTGAWRLTSRKKRLMIDCAGVTAELMIASIATMFWVFLPDGPLRSVTFILASTSWIMSLGVNLNPFMRFDGYYVLSDMLDVPNLQPRAFALGRWRLREALFALDLAPPEEVPSGLRRGMILYAWMVWVYRLMLFVGIALLVYYLFFKLLGIILFVVEMGVFVARPIWSEFKTWYSLRDRISATTRGRRWPWILIGAFILMILPLDRTIDAPAVLTPIGAAPIVAGEAARIDQILVRAGQTVAAGTPLMILTAPELERDVAATNVRIVKLQAQLDRAMSDAQDMSNRSVIERELAREQDALLGLDRRKDRLILRAPIAGQVADLNPEMHVGRWLSGAEILAHIVTPGRYDIQAYVSEDDIWRIEADARARFVPDDPVQASHAAKLVERATSASQALDQPILASTNGGPIAVNADAAKSLKPREALYRVRLVAAKEKSGPGLVIQTIPGSVSIAATPQSLAARWFGSAARIVRGEASLTG
jgi:putative peptide zinc metalloprotease protein